MGGYGPQSAGREPATVASPREARKISLQPTVVPLRQKRGAEAQHQVLGQAVLGTLSLGTSCGGGSGPPPHCTLPVEKPHVAEGLDFKFC